MRAYNVRFNPTSSGNLHLAHIYVALVNWTVAKESGGRFILRFDDNQEVWQYRMTEAQQYLISEQMTQDLALFGIEPDEIISQREKEEEVEVILENLTGGGMLKGLVWSDNSPEMAGRDIAYCAYNYPLTCEKVAFDFMSEINMLIRGEDLISEALLYSHICEKWRLPQPRQVYLPRLQDCNGGEISKSKGFMTVAQMVQDGWNAKDMELLLRASCLKQPLLGWRFDNIKERPQLTREFEKSSKGEVQEPGESGSAAFGDVIRTWSNSQTGSNDSNPWNHAA